MLNQNDLRELIDYDATSPILSIYLNTEPSKGNADAYKLRLRNMLKKINAPKDIETVERYFDHEYDWSGRSVVVFSSTEKNFFRAFPLEVPVHDLISYQDHPAIKPLNALLDDFGGYGVVLVDKQGARMFSFHLGELKEQEGILGEPVRHTKRGGASAVHGQRGGTAGQTHYEDQVIERNMKEAADFAVSFFEANKTRRILIGGSDENISLFRSQLPKAWQSLIQGTFPISMTASHAEVLKKALEIGQEYEQEKEAKLVTAVITTAAKGANAVTGFEKTIDAINDRKVETLLVAANFHQEGYHCPTCDTFAIDPVKPCTICGQEMKPSPDIIELAVNNVLRFGGDVKIIENNPDLERLGKIAATLRYS